LQTCQEEGPRSTAENTAKFGLPAIVGHCSVASYGRKVEAISV
jgi:hypothetical protein